MIKITTKIKLSQVYPIPPSKNEVDNALNNKANSSEINTLLSNKADISDLDDYIYVNNRSTDGFNNMTVDGCIWYRNKNLTHGVTPSAAVYSGLYLNLANNGTDYTKCLGLIENACNTSNVSRTYIRAYGNQASGRGTCEIGCNVDASGNAYTNAPTPETSDNSAKIATTAYVKANLGTVANKNVFSLGGVNNLNWGTNNDYIPDKTVLAYWNGRYNSTSSNLQYCSKGAFGDMAIKNTSDLGTWTSVTISAVTTYCSSAAGNYMSVYQNPIIKLCCVGFNISLAATTIPGNTAIINGFPKPLHNFGCACMDSNGVGVRMYISTTGSLMLDGAKTLSSSTWVNGSVTYPYSSL